MKALISKNNIGPKGLTIQDIEFDDTISKTEVLVEVKACGLNRADLLQSYGRYPAPPGSLNPEVLGLEFSGKVLKIGELVKSVQTGDLVMGITANAAMAEQIKAEESTLIKIPSYMTFEEAACIPEAFVTAYDALILQACAQSGDSVLITAIGSSVGLASMQIAQAYDMTTFGTSRNQDKINQAIKLGLNYGLPNESYSEQVLKLTNNIGVNNILELVGGQNLASDINCSSNRAKIVLIGLTGGTKTEINLAKILSKRISIIGTTLRSRGIFEKSDITKRFNSDLMPLFDKKILKPNLYKTYPYKNFYDAFCELENNNNFGKIVLSLNSL